MLRKAGFMTVIALILIISSSGAGSGGLEPIVLVYAGRMPGYADSLAAIINETGTRTVVAKSDAVLRSLANLPQVRCILIPAINPSDFDFLREFAPVLQKHFEEGGSLVGLSACCSMELKALATTVFPIRGNATGKGTMIGDRYGSTYVLSDVLEEITGGLPARFVVTQSDYTYQSGSGGPVSPSSELGSLKVLYREEPSGIPIVVALERNGGGRSVSLPGCYVATVERLPFYWGRLVKEQEFRELLRRSVAWAMAGSRRYDEWAASWDQRLKAEAERRSQIEEAGRTALKKSRWARLCLIVGLWSAGLLVQGFLAIRFIVSRMRMPGGNEW